MGNLGVFPFGNTVKQVVQTDRSPKMVFVLGVYASAVHARWLSSDCKTKVNALAVASEPEIFWRGEAAKPVIDEIPIPGPLGQLVLASAKFNGPSGRSLDEAYLSPLGIGRSDTWLCDIFPYAHVNPGQQKAIEREYLPVVQEYGLPNPTIRPAPTSGPEEERREEIWTEFVESEAEIMILLGDKPIKWFFFGLAPQYRRLSDFGTDADSYGRRHSFAIRDRELSVIPLVHPRQASRLGASSIMWADLHREWKDNKASNLI